MRVILIATVLLAVTGTISGRVYGKCQFVKGLKADKIPMSEIKQWVCLADAVSGMESTKEGGGKYGIIQIPSDWCLKGRAGNKCNVKCEDLINKNNDPLSLSIKCGQEIVKQHGFKFWPEWGRHCEGKPLPDVYSC